MRALLPLIAVLSCLALLSACSGSGTQLDHNASPVAEQMASPGETATDWPVSLPEDSRRPWEQLDSAGKVIPQHGALSFDAGTEFIRGADADSSGGDTASLTQALHLGSGNSGAKQLSFALYRLSTGGEQPGALALDINLHAISGGSGPSPYYIGLSDYSKGSWEWRGPFTDGQIRLSAAAGVAAGADYASPLGNVFVAVLAFDGADLDVVGIGFELADSLDTTPPPAPAALGVTGASGSLLLEWTPSAAADLAGYRVYYSGSSFSSSSDSGVQSVGYLEGSSRQVFSLPAGGTRFFAVSAVDHSGNESALSNVDSDNASAGAQLPLVVTTDLVAGNLNAAATLSASGADSYDYDLDGDGIYEITDSVSSSQSIDTGNTGLLRPGVRGHSSGGAVALGGVSLLISAGFPPVAALTSDIDEFTLWGDTAEVNFDASASSDIDSAALEYAFDPEGDGTYNAFSSNPLRNKIYSAAGYKYASVRVRDGDGYEDTAYRLIKGNQSAGFEVRYVHAKNSTGINNSLAEVNGRPAIAYYSAGDSTLYYVRALDSRGNLWSTPIPLEANNSQYCSLCVIKGNPAIAYWRASDSHVRYIRCATPNGNVLADWSNAPVDLGGPFGMMEKPDLCEVNGNPAIFFGDGSSVQYIRATTATGTGNVTGDWANPYFQIDTSCSGQNAQLELINGQPAVIYVSSGPVVKYKRATNGTGASALDWPAVGVTISATSQPNMAISFKEVNGRPAAIWYDTSSNKLQYVRSNTPGGELLADWPLPSIASISTNSGQFCNLAVIAGRPAVLYEDNSWGSGKRFRWATDAAGSAWGQEFFIGRQSSGQDYNQWTCLQEINGEPAASLYFSTGNSAAYALVDLEQ